MKALWILLSFCTAVSFADAQAVSINNEKFDDKLNSLLDFSVPLISVADLNKLKNEIILLDGRELEEFEISHIPDAIFLGFENPEFSVLDDIDKDNDVLVLYCSIGYRSEKIGEKLQQMGYKNVYNLYGSIFEWANQELELVDSNGEKTQRLHAYDANWSRWIRNPKIIKIW